MNVNLSELQQMVLDFRSTESPGDSYLARVTRCINLALNRMAGDVPEALVPRQEHVVLLPQVKGTDASVAARISATGDTRVMKFTQPDGSALVNWLPTVDGTWDGIMHIEFTDPSGQRHRRQSLEWWTSPGQEADDFYVTLDRPWPAALTVTDYMDFRIYQPEFFLDKSVMRVLDPAHIYTEGRQQVWSIDAAGASRQAMVDWAGEASGRPERMWRGRHFQVPAPQLKPELKPVSDKVTAWAGPERQGTFRVCYTYVWGRKDEEWQDSPGDTRDPQWESAPSEWSDPVDYSTAGVTGALKMVGANIDAMKGFDVTGTLRAGRSGIRIRWYIARDAVYLGGGGSSRFDRVEAAGKAYLLAEVEPSSANSLGPATYVWDGSVSPDYHRPLKHSTGYYAYQTYPSPDNRYELDFRTLHLPTQLATPTDTAPVQQDAVPALVELALYHLSLMDGVDQASAQIHLGRYNDLARDFRRRYANVASAVEPVPLGGHRLGRRFGRFNQT